MRLCLSKDILVRSLLFTSRFTCGERLPPRVKNFDSRMTSPWLGSWDVLKVADFSGAMYVSWEVQVVRKCRLGNEPSAIAKVMILLVATRGCSRHAFLSEQLPLTYIASPSYRGNSIAAPRLWKISMPTAVHKMEKNMVLAMGLEKSEAFNLTVLESLPWCWQANSCQT